MPRIDPIQLLNCLSVLLSPNGGIKSRDEVQRLASLMTKFSKKLVSKCIYIQILKCTETELLGLFMGSGGWLLVHMWLTESIVAKNWPLVRELLELLLLVPVDIERLKTNNCPKLVKELSKEGNQIDIRALASKLVEQWLKTVKGEQVIPIDISEISKIKSDAHNIVNNAINAEVCDENITENNNGIVENQVSLIDIKSETIDNKIEKESDNDEDSDKKDLLVLKISLKDGNKIVSQVDDSDSKSLKSSDADTKEHKSKSKEKSRDRSSSSKSSSSSSKHSHRSHSSSSDKHKSSHKSGSSSSSSSRRSSKDETKEKDKDRHSSSRSKSDSKSRKSSDKSSSSSSKSKDERSSKSSSERDRNKHKEKDDKNDKIKDSSQKSSEKSSDEKLESPSIHKLGKIPKLSDVKKEKPSISIEVRKPDEPKPKTVKTYHSRFRKHGLEEEVKPPPSRATLLNKKPPPPALPPSVPIPKRPSPVHNEPPPEKKPKIIESIEKPGAIKLIPPKPKPMMLLESDMFMDALNASATNKKEPKKRKRRTSGSKDGNPASDGSPPHTPTPHSPSSESKSVPPRFYQDTLETEENKEKLETSVDKNDTSEADLEIAVEDIELPPHTLTVNGIKGVLCYHKRKGPKKSIKWKPDSELEEIQYFELDETERVNVTKTFTDMKHLERINERDAFQKARNLSTDDIMEEKTSWKILIPIDLDGQVQVEYGKNSKEKDIQAIRQKGTLQPLYFHKSMIPDSPLEAEPETHTYSEPQIIPLQDATGNQDNVSDFRNMPWPEPKGNAPAIGSVSVTPMFATNIPQFPNGFPNPQFAGGVPGLPGPNMLPGEWPNGMNPMIAPMAPGNLAPGVLPPGALPPGSMPPGSMPPGSMPPGMMLPTEGMMMGPDMFGVNQMYPMGLPDGFNMQPNMFPPMDFNMAGPPGVPGPEAFGGANNFRGAMRGRGNGGHWRGKQTTNWDNTQRGRGAQRGGRKVCMYFQRKGSCRQGDNCTFLHPGVNGPYLS